VVTGDGDCTSIGGNHFIHGCRRNIDLTVVVVNNNNYGMTGGQYSPTTPLGSLTKTSVYGSYEPPFDVCQLAAGAGATYVAQRADLPAGAAEKLHTEGHTPPGLFRYRGHERLPESLRETQ
jgi:2-oxoglutarate ferredoxin oxidoreductase subunit beta